MVTIIHVKSDQKCKMFHVCKWENDHVVISVEISHCLSDISENIVLFLSAFVEPAWNSFCWTSWFFPPAAASSRRLPLISSTSMWFIFNAVLEPSHLAGRLLSSGDGTLEYRPPLPACWTAGGGKQRSERINNINKLRSGAAGAPSTQLRCAGKFLRVRPGSVRRWRWRSENKYLHVCYWLLDPKLQFSKMKEKLQRVSAQSLEVQESLLLCTRIKYR